MKKPFFESRFWKVVVFVLPILLKKAHFVKTEKDVKIIDNVTEVLKP
jgi:hypothetical protein